MSIIYKEDLLKLMEKGCSDPECKGPHAQHDHMTLIQQCHPGKGTVVGFCRNEGILIIACKVCKRVSANVAVAERSPNVQTLTE
jgi:hypothetical protein